MFSIPTSVVLGYCFCLKWIVQSIVLTPLMCTMKEYAVPFQGYLYTCGCKMHEESCGGAVGRNTELQPVRLRVRFPIVSLGFFHRHIPSSRTMVLGSTQPLTEMSTGNISWG